MRTRGGPQKKVTLRQRYSPSLASNSSAPSPNGIHFPHQRHDFSWLTTSFLLANGFSFSHQRQQVFFLTNGILSTNGTILNHQRYSFLAATTPNFLANGTRFSSAKGDISPYQRHSSLSPTTAILLANGTLSSPPTVFFPLANDNNNNTYSHQRNSVSSTNGIFSLLTNDIISSMPPLPTYPEHSLLILAHVLHFEAHAARVQKNNAETLS